MSLDATRQPARRIAIVGGGISGLASAYLLARDHHVTLYEAAPRLGGHARTVNAGRHGTQPVDTGFIVFNYVTYPHLTAMFRDLEVPVEPSDMSFGATIDGGRIEYGLRDLSALTAQKRNLARPAYWQMIRDILRFNSRAEATAKDEAATVADLMDDLALGDWFRRYYLTPLCGAIWSTPPSEIVNFPARALLQFFRNHALLSASGQHQWYTVSGGSRSYVERVTEHLTAQGVALRPGTPVTSVQRDPAGVTIHAEGCDPARYDEVILATHSDVALKLLAQPDAAEQAALSAIRFQDNEMTLHADTSQMPQRRAVWSSWVYKAETGRDEPAIGVTYWMNRLQNIDPADPLFVSLNPARSVAEHLIYDQKTFRHPVFDGPALNAQQQLRRMQGRNRTWFAGAWTRHGFHEDGFASAVRIAREMERSRALVAA
ncbi:NAD(P)/FAD-dependent oxidoreductase [Vannielia litorea]|uniref:NAD(P)/FAD-dependent oxidoreductase n=1 Tax=Vannielia litorea TaxID=1217970 RepID=UPI001C9379E5|nr:FAD-dependent oxidoreductase [Vannielia litorea]MBY6049674.1 FAD-dependent oxidoreductase [Vannielia litorea]MBY6077088.1 FAD-dependent oxidoreductase [Vannielia litorea]